MEGREKKGVQGGIGNAEREGEVRKGIENRGGGERGKGKGRD